MMLRLPHIALTCTAILGISVTQTEASFAPVYLTDAVDWVEHMQSAVFSDRDNRVANTELRVVENLQPQLDPGAVTLSEPKLEDESSSVFNLEFEDVAEGGNTRARGDDGTLELEEMTLDEFLGTLPNDKSGLD